MPDTSGDMVLTAPIAKLRFLVGTRLTLTAPKPVLTMKPGGNLVLTAPKPTITFADVYNALILTAPLATLTISSNYTYGSLTLTAPLPRITLSGHTEYNELILLAPAAQLIISSPNTHGTLVLVVPKAKLTFSASTGTVGSLTLTAPAPTITISGFTSTSGSLILTTPAPKLTFAMLALLSKCIVLNTDIWEVTEYTWTFDQLVKFGDNYLAVDSTGIYLLGGDTNNGLSISSTIETPEDEFDISQDMRTGGMRDGGGISFKRPTYLDVILKSEMEMKLTINTENESSTIYDVESAEEKEIRRLFTYDADHGKYFSYSLRNIGGQDFDLYGIEQSFDILPRRI